MESSHPVIAVVGAGYVGLPLAAAFSKKNFQVRVFDISQKRVEEINKGYDRTDTLSEYELVYLQDPELTCPRLIVSTKPEILKSTAPDPTFFIITVPTDIDRQFKPDLEALKAASLTVSKFLKDGDVVIYESTVYPGVTENICKPILESGGCTNFGLGYSPERINPGDIEHTVNNVIKIVSGSTPETLERIRDLYSHIIPAGLHCAPSIRVAEAAKALENSQRDLNIALMNEMAMICQRLGIDVHDVITAAATKWNFLPFKPGLVGGHCIAVDPYYLAACAEEVGIHPQVILAGRRINSGMAPYVAKQIVKERLKRQVSGDVLVLGITFKEDVPDIRNSRVPDLIHELEDYGIKTWTWDPLADANEVHREYGIVLSKLYFKDVGIQTLVVAVAHKGIVEIATKLAEELQIPLIIDIKGIMPKQDNVWRL